MRSWSAFSLASVVLLTIGGAQAGSARAQTSLECSPARLQEIGCVGYDHEVGAPLIFLEEPAVLLASAFASHCSVTQPELLACLADHPDARVRRNLRFLRWLGRLEASDPDRYSREVSLLLRRGRRIIATRRGE